MTAANNSAQPRVLVVEDDENMRLSVTVELTANDLAVTGVSSLAAAERALSAGSFECAVFDRMLGDEDSVDFVHLRRKAGWSVPVLFLTARDTLTDRVAGFEHGGDDYLVKPFAMAEMTARVLVLCRRAGAGRPAVLRYADLEMDCARKQVHRGGALLTLSDKEFAVLEMLLAEPEQAMSRAKLIEHCWDASTDPLSNVVDVAVKRLRRKLGEPELIHAVRGVGYRLAR
ncbi:response regulator transcription factor [Saccharopolyspora indica]|uniref:response regulator transcription factor n=1 Tax=Saccharopolyspora indica TaxID=1229659 RepID=UPI0022EAB265|nr:response regulator transcription factor [Saccharopolyspora indica]MDA3647191.1 response regulator transcription factor [Saccharopolyspora indica]